MDFFINEIIEDEEIRSLLRSDPQGLNEKAKALAKEFEENGSCEHPGEGMLPLFVLAHLADRTREINGKRGIPEEITVATLKDVNLWIENHRTKYGTPGMMEFGWLNFHIRGELFRLGRLQFRPIKTDRAPSGEWVLETHVPQGEPLSAEACLDSFARAKVFFSEYFPEVRADYFDCDSWLLNPNHAYLMGENSNVVKFMRLWDLKLIRCARKSSSTISRVFGFGTKREHLPNAPENTAMQKKVKAFLLAGGDLSDTYGVRKIDD